MGLGQWHVARWTKMYNFGVVSAYEKDLQSWSRYGSMKKVMIRFQATTRTWDRPQRQKIEKTATNPKQTTPTKSTSFILVDSACLEYVILSNMNERGEICSWGHRLSGLLPFKVVSVLVILLTLQHHSRILACDCNLTPGDKQQPSCLHRRPAFVFLFDSKCALILWTPLLVESSWEKLQQEIKFTAVCQNQLHFYHLQPHILPKVVKEAECFKNCKKFCS